MQSPFFTWMDVERYLKNKTCMWLCIPSFVFDIDCWIDGMEVRCFYTEDDVNDYLVDIFGDSYSMERSSVTMAMGGEYPVKIEILQDDPKERNRSESTYISPLWGELKYIYKKCISTKNAKVIHADLWRSGPIMSSFHTFGKKISSDFIISHSNGFKSNKIKRVFEQCVIAERILVVDATMGCFHNEETPDVSFESFIESLWFSRDKKSKMDVVGCFADHIRSVQKEECGKSALKIFTLPSKSSFFDITGHRIEVGEHFGKDQENPWDVSDHLHSLGKELGVDEVLINLAPGFNENNAPFIFDHRINHFFFRSHEDCDMNNDYRERIILDMIDTYNSYRSEDHYIHNVNITMNGYW